MNDLELRVAAAFHFFCFLIRFWKGFTRLAGKTRLYAHSHMLQDFD